ncbi:MAG TPA: SDR family NAD(P)-dependent oxidoreductase [Candidatus Dormibacteraeota bacterium]|nr:SDR family NAD(P)-dependent oxidoreductase [Candidatus Dormibacteraeota bacterium]
MNLEGVAALVTGGASGLGRGAVAALHAAGASVVVVDLPQSAGGELAASLGDRALFSAADVTDEAQVAAAIDLATKRFGGLRVAVSCAGIGRAGKILGRKGVLPLDAFRSVIEVNLVGTFNVTRLAAAAMATEPPLDGERGVIVNTASIAAFEGQVGQAAYAASKGGVVALTLPIARELAAHQVRCMAVAPGTFDTPMLAGLPAEAVQKLASDIPHPSRLGRPAEFGALVRHIVENPMLNGSVIRLDGALRMGVS